VHPIRSETDGLEGWIELDVDGDHVALASAPSGHVELAVDRLRSGHALEERELRRRLDSRRYPTITGDVVTMTEADEEGRVRVRGEVTLKGATRSHEDEMQVFVVDERTIRLVGESVFDIREFGLEPPRILLLKVEPEVKVAVDIVAAREDGHA
jgi:polyisoprenoid-binding protein YceI